VSKTDTWQLVDFLHRLPMCLGCLDALAATSVDCDPSLRSITERANAKRERARYRMGSQQGALRTAHHDAHQAFSPKRAGPSDVRKK
jgi:hypothetical protein